MRSGSTLPAHPCGDILRAPVGRRGARACAAEGAAPNSHACRWGSELLRSTSRAVRWSPMATLMRWRLGTSLDHGVMCGTAWFSLRGALLRVACSGAGYHLASVRGEVLPCALDCRTYGTLRVAADRRQRLGERSAASGGADLLCGERRAHRVRFEDFALASVEAAGKG